MLTKKDYISNPQTTLMKLYDLHINKTEYADKEGLYFEPQKTSLEKAWDALHLLYTQETQVKSSEYDAFLSLLSQASGELSNNMMVYIDCHQIGAEIRPGNKINLKARIVDELRRIVDRGVLDFKRAIDEESRVWAIVTPFKHLGLRIVDDSVAIGNDKYFLNLNQFKDKTEGRKGEATENKITEIFENLIPDNNEIICEVKLFNFKSKCSSLELQNHENQKLSKIERYLNFLKFKEKCQVYENGCLKINIYVVEGNGGQMREDHNSIPNDRVAIIDDRISNFVFKSIMNGVEIPDFLDKIYNLIIGAVVSKNEKCSFFEYENDFYFVNKDVYRIENKNRLVVYKNEIEIDSFE